MKATAKKSKIITEADIDGPMMGGIGMTKEEMIQIAKWVEEQKAINNKKSTSKLPK